MPEPKPAVSWVLSAREDISAQIVLERIRELARKYNTVMTKWREGGLELSVFTDFLGELDTLFLISFPFIYDQNRKVAMEFFEFWARFVSPAKTTFSNASGVTAEHINRIIEFTFNLLSALNQIGLYSVRKKVKVGTREKAIEVTLGSG